MKNSDEGCARVFFLNFLRVDNNLTSTEVSVVGKLNVVLQEMRCIALRFCRNIK